MDLFCGPAGSGAVCVSLRRISDAFVELAAAGLFGLHTIGFWQALGLLLLSRILFGGFGGHGHGPGPSKKRRQMEERWEQMTPEEREKFRQGMHGRCGNLGAPPAEAREKV